MSTGREHVGGTCLQGENMMEGHVYNHRTTSQTGAGTKITDVKIKYCACTIVCSTLAVLWNES